VAGQADQPVTVQAAIEASGERDPDTIYISFYASTDTQITASDYYLGQVNLAFSVNSWTVVTLRCAFPASIPPGTYYVGWIIDPGNINDETNELNNTAFNPSSMLTVVKASKTVLYVDSSARGTHDGSSWNNAFSSLQDALAKAQAGCEIRVAGGAYTPDRGIGVTRGDRRATFELEQGVTVSGGYAGVGEADPDARDTRIHPTILSGDLNSNDVAIADVSELCTDPSRMDNSLHVVTVASGDHATILDGVRIAGGFADATPGDSQGAGLYILGGSPRVQGCEFSENWAAVGGGAIYSTEGNPELIDCTLWGNACGSGPEDDRGAGGAIFVRGGSPALVNCSIHGNFVWGSGGAVALSPGGILSAINCCLHANRATVRGGVIYALDSQTMLVNCTLADNSQDNPEGAIVCESSDVREPGELRIANSILWGREQQIAGPSGSLITVAYSDVQGGWPGVGNLDANPLFVNPDGPDGLAGTSDDNLRLSRDSPCIDAGNADALPEDVLDLDNDGNTQEPLPLDRDGNGRTVGNTVDLGAYETSTSDDGSPPGRC
jgi:predicted outer membrane repeat protein